MCARGGKQSNNFHSLFFRCVHRDRNCLLFGSCGLFFVDIFPYSSPAIWNYSVYSFHSSLFFQRKHLNKFLVFGNCLQTQFPLYSIPFCWQIMNLCINGKRQCHRSSFYNFQRFGILISSSSFHYICLFKHFSSMILFVAVIIDYHIIASKWCWSKKIKRGRQNIVKRYIE